MLIDVARRVRFISLLSITNNNTQHADTPKTVQYRTTQESREKREREGEE